jgi:predicted DNA-binding protein
MRPKLDEVIPIRLPRQHKIALRRIARRTGRGIGAIVREMIERRIADDKQVSSAGVDEGADIEIAAETRTEIRDLGAAA